MTLTPEQRQQLRAALPPRLLARRSVAASGCWEWTASRTECGYGRISWKGRVTRVHRLVAHLIHGLDLSDPEQAALHRCDNPPCFNPDHIYVGTQRQNVADMVQRHRHRGGGKKKTHCAKGHPLEGGNVKPAGTGRRCRTCQQESSRAYYQQRKSRDPLWPGKGRSQWPASALAAHRAVLDATDTQETP